jgi:hypothetical protein
VHGSAAANPIARLLGAAARLQVLAFLCTTPLSQHQIQEARLLAPVQHLAV